MKPLQLNKVSTQDFIKYLQSTWQLQQNIFSTIAHDALYVKYQPLRHPLIFYYGHTSTFYINKMNLGGLIQDRINPNFQTMFSVGVDQMDWDDLDQSHYEFPTKEQLFQYRKQVKNKVIGWIQKNHIDGSKISWNDPSWIVVMAIEHQNIHIQTSSVLARTVQISKVQPNPKLQICKQSRRIPQSVPKNILVDIKGINKEWGKQINSTRGYGWDVEFGNRLLQSKDFKVSKFLVSNAQFFEFIKDGGYKNQNYWNDQGKMWLKSNRCKSHPFFWVKQKDGQFKYRCIYEQIDMPWDWPVDVNYLQAKAFCNWKSQKTGLPVRLPNQDQWYSIRQLYQQDVYDWKFGAAGNINLQYFASSTPIDKFSETGGVCDIIGNVWQWTETPVYSFNNYKVHQIYEDFSIPTFDQRHNLILGGSFISRGNLAMKQARYAFRRHFFQHAGFRYIVTKQPARKQLPNQYQTDDLSNNYLEFHFGPQYFGVPNYPKACAQYCIELNEKYGRGWGKCADLGCAVGRSTFELAKRFQNVVGLDLSVRFFQLGLKCIQKKLLKYSITRQGKLKDQRKIDMQQLGLESLKKKVEFKQQDVTILDIKKFHSYDLIFCGNLIDRMAKPKVFLQNIHKYLNKGGLLVITSPYTWLPNWTKPTQWVGGYEKADGTKVGTLDGIRQCLSENFEQVGDVRAIPFVLRQTLRKYQHSVAEGTSWRLK